jgi:UDP-N-acetylglucosamine pyrophosphorylase
VLKLNGGLGTSMGLEKAKSLLEVGALITLRGEGQEVLRARAVACK